MLVGLLVLAVWASACASGGKSRRKTNLPHGNNVEYKYGAKMLTQRFADRDELHYSLSDLKLRPELSINGRAERGHLFEIGFSASCKLSAPPPEKLTLDFTHEIAKRTVWHFPGPVPSDGLTQNANLDIIFVADGQSYKLPRHFQIELKKDLPSDTTFYESYITEIPLKEFLRIANSQVVKVEMNSVASFNIDTETLAALKHFAGLVSDRELW